MNDEDRRKNVNWEPRPKETWVFGRDKPFIAGQETRDPPPAAPEELQAD